VIREVPRFLNCFNGYSRRPKIVETVRRPISWIGLINVLTEAVSLTELRSKRLRLDAVNDGTLLYDTVDMALNQKLAAIQGRKAIVLLTDGVDRGSKRGSLKHNLRDAEESNIVIYTVQYNTLP